ncbi:dihydrodipicolinate synthase family protein [Niabella aquatica]
MGEKKGFVPVMLTPFHEDGNIDFGGLTLLTNFYLDAGAKGLFANCQSSEMFDLSPEERIGIIAHVIKVAEAKVPVVAAGNFGNTIREQAGFVKQVHDTGVSAVIILTGLLANESEGDDILEQRINELLSLTGDIPLGFYECPVPYKRVLPPQLLGKLVQTGRVTYHKDTCLDIAQVREKNRLCAGINGFGLYDAYMVHAVESLRSGSAGLSCIQGNYFPELVVWLCDHYNNAALQEQVQMVQQFFIDEMEVMHRYYPQSAKYFLQEAGLPVAAYVRGKNSNEVPEAVKKAMDDLALRYRSIAQILK